MTNVPEIDVIVLSWNRLESTLETIDSALAQERVGPHVWIVDQGSDSACVEALRLRAVEDSRLTLIELAENVGIPGGRNRAIQPGRAAVIVSIDNDAVFETSADLAYVAKRFEEDPQLGAIGFRVVTYQTGEDDRLSWAYPRSLRAQRDTAFVTTRFAGGAHAVRREAWERTRGYDESLFFYWEELDLSYQLIEAGYRIEYDPTVRIRHKVDPNRRVEWSSGRFYYLVRNALYIDWKYYRSLRRVAARAVGYQLKGAYNGLLSQALRGAVDAVSMALRHNASPLSQHARSYISAHDDRHRGRLIDRIRTEVLERLP